MVIPREVVTRGMKARLQWLCDDPKEVVMRGPSSPFLSIPCLFDSVESVLKLYLCAMRRTFYVNFARLPFILREARALELFHWSCGEPKGQVQMCNYSENLFHVT